MTRRCGPGPTIVFPSAWTRPRSGRSRPAMILSNVDLPQPLGPTRQTNSPSAMRSVTSSSAWTFSVLVRNHFETCSRTSLEGTVLAGLISVAAISVQPFDEPRQVRCFAQESCPLGIRDELLILIRGNVCGRHDAFPCLGNQICRHLASCLSRQFLPYHLLGIIRMRE